MSNKHRSFTIYRIRDNIADVPVQKFEDVLIDPPPHKLVSFDLSGDYNYSAKLFVVEPIPKKPLWAEFLKPGFGELEVVKEAVANSALMVLKIRMRKNCYFAISFGIGRFLLKPNSYVRNYGLRTSLNTMFQKQLPGQEFSPERIRSIDAKTVAANTIHTRRQTDRKATFEAFGLDTQRDFLKMVTGSPCVPEEWGTRITGADAIYINQEINLRRLGDICRKIEKMYQRDDYKELFDWVDNINIVTDVDLIKELENQLLINLKTRNISALELAPPELVDWDEIDYFLYNIDREAKPKDLYIVDYLKKLDEKNKLGDLNIKKLKTTHKVEALDQNENTIHSWSVFKCLSGEVIVNGKTYLISGGDFFDIAANYIKQLNTFIKALKECRKKLPTSAEDKNEGDYNADAANSSYKYLLLDKKTVRVSGKTTPIEICDVLSEDGFFIHVKRKLGSSSLSHLFSQGTVSADLFLMSQEYRKKVFTQIEKAELDREKQGGRYRFKGRFSNFDLAGIDPSKYEVVYAIIAKWDNRKFVDALPFFSKVNLRRHVEDLRRMGYKVSYKRIKVT